MVTTPRTSQQLSGVDLLKYIMAFAVVTIHFRSIYGTTPEAPDISEWFIRMAVPYYFIASGYLLERKLASETAVPDARRLTRRRAGKLFRLWACWIVIYIPLSAAGFYISHEPAPEFILHYFISLAINGWVPLAPQFWFIYSMIWVCLIISLTIHIKHYRLILAIPFAAVTLLQWSEPSVYILSCIKELTENNLGGGIYFLAGMLLYSHDRFSRTWVALAALTLSYALYCLGLPYWQLTGGCGFFIISLKLPLQATPVLTGLRYQSMWIYYTHMYLIHTCATLLHAQDYITSLDLLMILAFMICAMSAQALYLGQQHSRLLRMLVS